MKKNKRRQKAKLTLACLFIVYNIINLTRHEGICLMRQYLRDNSLDFEQRDQVVHITTKCFDLQKI